MYSIVARNVHEALPLAVNVMNNHGVPRDSRNGPVKVLTGATAIEYEIPSERVLFHPERDANPFFHLMESIWMMAGANDVAFPATFAKNIASYSDDGKILHGAYGHRWRRHFGVDQIEWAINRLTANPDDRRVVIDMWSPEIDTLQADRDGKDVPCNITLTLQINHLGRLDMCVFNRSNDMVWGALGANAVHFSFLQEFIARSVGCLLGSYWQISANFHAYLATLEKVKSLQVDINPYRVHEVAPYPILGESGWRVWMEDASILLDEGPIVGFRDPFFRRVVTPMYHAHAVYKRGEYEAAKEILQQCEATDWRRACIEWIDRRAAEKARK